MSLEQDVARALAPLPVGYADVLDRVVDALEAEPRAVAPWLGGSLGRGVADAGSDLDLIVTVLEGAVDDFVAEGTETWIHLKPVITLEIPGPAGGFALTMPDGLRMDVVLERESDLTGTAHRHRVPVFDRRLDRVALPAADETADGPDIVRMEAIVREFARQLAIFPDAVVAREDWLLGQEAVHNYRAFLYQLYVESNAPLPPMGVKQWSAKLTAAQQDRLKSLPVPTADENAVIDAMQQVQHVLRTEGRALVESAGGAWPDVAVRAGLARWEARGLDAGLRPEERVRHEPASRRSLS